MTGRRAWYAILAATMALFAALQINDPDPLVWITLYGVASLLFVAAWLGWMRRWAIVVVWIAYAIQGARDAPGFFDWLTNRPWSDLVGVMSVERSYIEDSRELLGLVVAAASLLVLWFWPPRSSAPPDATL